MGSRKSLILQTQLACQKHTLFTIDQKLNVTFSRYSQRRIYIDKFTREYGQGGFVFTSCLGLFLSNKAIGKDTEQDHNAHHCELQRGRNLEQVDHVSQRLKECRPKQDSDD